MKIQNSLKLSVLLLILAAGSACSSHKGSIPPSAHEPTTPIVPHIVTHKPVDFATLAKKGSEVVTLPSGHDIVVYPVNGKVMFAAEGILTDRSFEILQNETSLLHPDERARAFSRHLNQVLANIERVQGKVTFREDRLGYFTVLLPYDSQGLFSSLRDLEFGKGHRVSLNPVIHDPGVLKAIRAVRPTADELPPRQGSRDASTGFSGLERMGAPDFVRMAEAETGAKINGSSVTVGITDTGITYNHPTFTSSDGTNRIVYMKDFTGEGATYFVAGARFQAVAGESAEELTVNAEVVVTPRLPGRPAGDKLTAINGLKIKVSPELREKLLNAAVGAKFGFLNEDGLQTDGDAVDINNNGKVDDKLYMILIPGKTVEEDVLYFDPAGNGDFRLSPPLADWNRTKQTISLFAEKIGFTIESSKLTLSSDERASVEARKVAFVGFDPGDHGSHVAGIAVGRKTIANDDDLTLARGVAPEAKLATIRVCANNGGCGATEAIVDLALNGGAEVINMSLGGLGPFNDGYGVQETTINRLTTLKNVLFVISAGNSGPGKQTVGSPSTARYSLSVGAAASREMIARQYQWPGHGSTGDDDFMLFFSSRGPTAAGGFKPNVAAPGTELSAIRLNTAPGSRGGLDVYWGTSMSAPAATGAYALLLDAIKKYNAKNPGKELTTNAVVLRQVLIDTARAFDVNRFDPLTGERLKGQYTWADQGTGMVNLPAAWKRLLEARDNALPTAISHEGKPVELDYQVVVSATGPNGIAYDGTRPTGNGIPPAFGTGLYLDYNAAETLRAVHIARKLPDALAGSAAAGTLTRDLETTRDEFELKTVIYGSDKVWLKPGVRDQLPCMSSEASRLSVIGRGVDIKVEKDGKATLTPFPASVLNVCLDRQMIANELAPGDHGALVYGYRAVGDRVASVPSFVVPVYITVPHRVLGNKTGYELDLNVRSFGVNRNYVQVPAGTSVVTVTLEVPEPKLDSKGQVTPEACAGVELMSLEGVNNAKSFKSRLLARAQSCESNGAPGKKRKISFSRTKPTAGIWDLHVFGLYKFVNSPFKLKVDYVTGQPSVDKIEGGVAALTGNFSWNLVDASMEVSVDSAKSAIEIANLEAKTNGEVAQDQIVYVESPLGKMRVYPEGIKTVTLTTGESDGNDLDIVVYECPTGLAEPDAQCSAAGSSAGPTDVESVNFVPKAGKAYALAVQGYTIKSSGAFVAGEKLVLGAERGNVVVSGESPSYKVDYSFSSELVAASKLLNHVLFTSGKYKITGSLTLRTPDGVTLDVLPVKIASGQ